MNHLLDRSTLSFQDTSEYQHFPDRYSRASTEVFNAHEYWRSYRTLFRGGPGVIDLLNRIAGAFFEQVGKTHATCVILRLTRSNDSHARCLTLRHLHEHRCVRSNEPIASALAAELAKFTGCMPELMRVRHNVVAHSNTIVTCGTNVRRHLEQSIDDELKASARFMNLLAGALGLEPISYGQWLMTEKYGAASLFSALRIGDQLCGGAQSAVDYGPLYEMGSASHDVECTVL